jgi:phenylpropionate dioxygenase-like ring-hydroxylating dioxygenase large terminal subunit
VTTFIKPTEIPIAGARTLPREYFTSPEILAEEMERIFLQRWICVGREDRISNPGEYW